MDFSAVKRLGKFRLFVMAITARLFHSASLPYRHPHLAGQKGKTMSSNYLTNSSGFTRINAHVGQLLDRAVDEHIDELSQRLGPDPASRGLNRHYDLSELMSQTMTRMVRTDRSIFGE